MKNHHLNSTGKLFIGACLICGLSACSPGERDTIVLETALNEAALKIDNDFSRIRQEIVVLAGKIETLYLAENVEASLKKADRSKYHLAENGVFYKPVDDGKSAVFVSGYVPITDHIKDIVYFTEPVEDDLRGVTERFPEVIQAYYNDKNSYNRIYPFFDVLSQYEPHMNIPDFNFYYLADKEHNPQKGGVWVNEPYVDPAGRGWMISAIAPVYVGAEVEGVAGLDVTISTITDRYTTGLKNAFIILDGRGMLVSLNESLTGLLALPKLQEHAYLETIKQDTYRTDHFNLLNSKSKSVRKAMNEIYNGGKNKVQFSHGNDNITILAAKIKELSWYIMLVIKE